jgi:hypothetical protein
MSWFFRIARTVGGGRLRLYTIIIFSFYLTDSLLENAALATTAAATTETVNARATTTSSTAAAWATGWRSGAWNAAFNSTLAGCVCCRKVSWASKWNWALAAWLALWEGFRSP